MAETVDTAQVGKRWRRTRLSGLLLYLGLKMGNEHAISIPGRRSGKTRTTPVAVVVVQGERYIVGNSPRSNWVMDARTVGWGILTSRRMKSLVRLREVPVEDRLPVLLQYPRQLPHNGRAFQLPADPDAWASVAAWFPVFRLS